MKKHTDSKAEERKLKGLHEKQKWSFGAPMGYTMKDVDGDDEAEVLALCLSLSDDEEYHKAVLASTHDERCQNLIGMGFEPILD